MNSAVAMTSETGHNRISTQALTAVAQGVAAEVLGIEPHLVRAEWSDDQGLLALTLALPLTVPPLAAVARNPALVGQLGGSIIQRALEAQPRILDTVARLTGSRLSRVNIRVTGVAHGPRGRVQ